ncbi:hypothetical protein [Yoonia sp. BS5-3]|uniref:Uncharacterized protein n=1 Tax=Yoonia phaeophyticola TaxID=3137369 RepID=A0ABZ2V1C2_9RHOB
MAVLRFGLANWMPVACRLKLREFAAMRHKLVITPDTGSHVAMHRSLNQCSGSIGDVMMLGGCHDSVCGSAMPMIV